MNTFRFAALICVIGILTACGDSTNDKTQRQDAISAQQHDNLPFVLANDFSDAEWKNGVLKKDGHSNVFYFLQKRGESQKLKVGDSLRFAKIGSATVQKIVPSEPNTNGIVSVFVTIDKDVDPIGDGYPNKIFVLSKVQSQ